MDELTTAEKRILDFEARDRTGYRPGAKDNEIRAEFGWRWTRYYLELARLLDREAAEAYNPILIHRLRTQRDRSIASKYVRR